VCGFSAAAHSVTHLLARIVHMVVAQRVAARGPPTPQSWRPSRRAMASETAMIDIGPDGPPAPPPPPSCGILRWLVDISTWALNRTDSEEWKVLLRALSSDEQQSVMRFLRMEDRKRALVSRLLQRRACFEVAGVGYASADINRTQGRKPFLANRSPHLVDLPNWNYNVSHEGKYVVLAAEPSVLCGIDVSAPEEARSGKTRLAADLLKVFQKELTSAELAKINAAKSEHRKLELFRQFWSLKESFTKARGDGIGCSFGRCDFGTRYERSAGSAGQQVDIARVVLDEQPQGQWKFFVQPLESDHWVSVARGPPAEAVDKQGAFRATFTQIELSASRLEAELTRPEPPFQRKAIIDLLPDELSDAYKRAACQSS